MSETEPHLESARDHDPRVGAVGLENPVTDNECPSGPQRLHERFLDQTSGEVRTDALVEAYLALEQQLEAHPRRTVPTSPDDYAITVEGDFFAANAEVNRKLHEAGFDQDQAQLVYDLAATHLLPMVAEVAAIYEAEGQIEQLRRDFGGDEQWRKVSRQVQVWGEGNLSAEVFSVLASTREGILAMHKMMSGNEPPLLSSAGEVKSLPTETELKQMMRDPRYWRDQDKTFVETVRDGFKQLYDH